MKKLIIIGAGGLGREAAWVAERLNQVSPSYNILGFCDDNRSLFYQTAYGFKILGTIEDVAKEVSQPLSFICAVGNNITRAALVERALQALWLPETLIDPSVIMAKDVRIGSGTYIGAGSIISPNACLGQHVIVNHCCSVGHDSELGDFVQVSPGARVSGNVRVGKGAMLASNSVVAPGKSVGEFSVVGASSFVVKAVPARVTVIGVPARVVFSHKNQETTPA